MTVKKFIALAFTTLLLHFAGCSQETSKVEIAAVNDENCKPENIAKMKDKGNREQFQEMCVRGGTFNSSPQKKW